jgi:SAM-dependent methyltransferase
MDQRVPKLYKAYLQAAERHFQKHAKGMTERNHSQHNLEPDFWNYMMADLLDSPDSFRGELTLEYGCGAGRNLVNMLAIAPIRRADGIDISKDNAVNSQAFVESKFGHGRSICLQGNGYSCLPFASEIYSFIMSHQVFIHIPNREIRKEILRDFVRVLRPGGIAVVHFKTMDQAVEYGDNSNSFPKNVTISPDDKELIEFDFLDAGFSEVGIREGLNFVDSELEFWVRAVR